MQICTFVATMFGYNRNLIHLLLSSIARRTVFTMSLIAAVLLVAIGLSFPFWGDRPGYEREWFDIGMGAAILYLFVFGGFVYYMVMYYSPSVDGMEDDGETEDISEDYGGLSASKKNDNSSK